MRVAITGATGFIGSHLVDALLKRGDEVQAWVRSANPQLRTGVQLYQVNLLDNSSVTQAMEQSRPEAIYHLAAQSLPTRSWQAPWETIQVNIASTINILEAAARTHFKGPLVVFGSSSEYAHQHDPNYPIDERYPLGAGSPYAVSKIAASQLAAVYHRRHGLAVFVVRPFFWVGPRKTGDFCSDVARSVVEIERGKLANLPVGNLEVIRDFLDVRDGVEATLAVAARGTPGEMYNICSGKGVVLRHVVDTYRSLSSVSFEINIDPARLRPLDEKVRVGDPTKVLLLDWHPMRNLQATLSDVLGYWRLQQSS
jgi:GDP-4-dehydro-6-deoxy-D-mannose reductase